MLPGKQNITVACLLFGFFLAPGTSFAGKERPALSRAEQGKVKDLTARLDGDSFRERERASRELRQLVDRLGESTRETLLEAWQAGTTTPEQRQRLRPVLQVVNQLRAERLKGLEASAELHVVGLYE